MTIPATLIWPLKFCAYMTGGTYVASVITSNVSQVDRLWTFLPTIYTAYFALLPLWPREPPYGLSILPYTPTGVVESLLVEYKPRALLMLSLVVIWMFRLSYNTYRRGLFSLQDEDYRWAVLRSQLHPVLFQITNLVFISAIQNVILLLLGLPSHAAATSYFTYESMGPLNLTDYTLAALALVILATEFTADNQQFAYHAWKHAVLAKKKDGENAKVEEYDASKQWPGARLDWTVKDAERGFCTRGLWAYARHPNFACEQSFWWVITLFPLLSAADSSTQSIPTALARATPAIVLSALFLASTSYSEDISAGKYPGYKEYQKRVSMFGPFGIVGKRSGIIGLITGEGVWKDE